MNRQIILCFVEYYLPGYRSGGPVRTIANFVENCGEEFDIRIITRDRDALDAEPYPSVKIDAWNMVGNAKVFYASDKTVNLYAIARHLRGTPHDALYLNSFFSFGFTVLPLLARRLRMAPQTPCVIAPRGEFSVGALALKRVKKYTYMCLAKAISLYQNLHWQASSGLEKADIIHRMGSIAHWVYVAPDLTPALTDELNRGAVRTAGPLRLIFLSRISPMKNLDFLLRVLARVTSNVELAIYGPQEDALYWKQCMRLIDQMPEHVNVTVFGEIPQEQVCDTFAAHDLFVFPTRGENFGHVIFESLTAGTPVLISDKTPWQQDAQGGLGVLPLDASIWVDAIQAWTELDHKVLAQQRRAAFEYAYVYSDDNKPLERNRQLFRSAFGEN